MKLRPTVLIAPYMTGHLDGSGENGNLNIRNNQIRSFCTENDKILFDFADIESYNPGGEYFLNRSANDGCYYYADGERRNWAEEWCAANPGECSSCSCAHSESLNCDLKGKAFWYMMARIAGWKSCVDRPTNLSASADPDQYAIRLTWSHTVAPDTYIIQRQENDENWNLNYSQISGNETSFTDAELSESTYRYRLVARSNAGPDGEPCDSIPTDAVAGSLTVDSAPIAPFHLSATADINNRSIALSWEDGSDNESGFYVQRQICGSDWNHTYATLSENTIQFTDDSLDAGEYKYRIVAFNDTGNSKATNEASATITEIQDEKPESPGILVSEVIDGNSIKLTWLDNSTNETGFVLQRKKDSSSFCSIKTLPADTEIFLDKDLPSGHTYTYRVKAKNSAGYSDFSNESSKYIAADDGSLTLKQGVNDYKGCTDTYLYLKEPDKNFGDTKYKYVTNDPKTHFAVKFELPDDLNGKTIESAKLVLYCWTVKNFHENQHLKLYEIKEEWSEESASWSNRNGKESWHQPGAETDEAPIGQYLIPNTSHYPEFDITELVGEWIDGSKPNNGLLLTNETTVTTGIKASEYSEYARPYLKISYSSNPTENTKPVSKVIIDASTVETGVNVVIDGSNSYDEDGDPLTYRWQLVSKPSGSEADILDATSDSAEFVADIQGDYIVSLVVNDGIDDSTESRIHITAKSNTKPVAQISIDGTTIRTGEKCYLNAGKSSDKDNDELSYTWFFVSKPSGSMAEFSHAHAVSNDFTTDIDGEYIVGLIVNDGNEDSDEATVTITADSNDENARPVAKIVTDGLNVTAGSQVFLDGSQSIDTDGDTLSYSWQMISKPAWSRASLSNGTDASVWFMTDGLGEYSVGLIVNDGVEESVQEMIVITAVPEDENTVPVAQIMIDGNEVETGANVYLDGSMSSDNDGDALTFTWRIISKPPGSNSDLEDPHSGSTGFMVDMDGEYVVSLVVNDGISNSETKSVHIVSTSPVVNSRPVAKVSIADAEVIIGSKVILDGSKSYDDDGDELTFTWKLATKPSGSPSTLSSTDRKRVGFIADTDGSYFIQLIVNDGKIDSDPVVVQIDSIVPEDDHPVTHVSNAIDSINILDNQVFKNSKHKNKFIAKLKRTLRKINKNQNKVAYKKLARLLVRVDGCIKTGSPEKNDWIQDCENQMYFYNLISNTMEMLK